MMTRRNFAKAGAALLAGAALRSPFSSSAAEFGTPRLTLPTPEQIAWQDCEIGLLYSFDLPIAAGVTVGDNEARWALHPDLYQPNKLDTDQWIEAAKGCGATYAVFTATHFSGFMQWQSDVYPYGLKQTSWRGGKGDVVGDFISSCLKAGIKPGIFVSNHNNVYQHVLNYYVDWGHGRGQPAQAKFNQIAEDQARELCCRYGPLIELWFDAGTKTPKEGGPDILPIFEKHQPGAIFYSSKQRADHRWIGNESGDAGDPCWATMPGGKDALSHNAPGWQKFLSSGDPDGSVWSPGMVDVPLRGTNHIHKWFWAPNQDQAVQETDNLLKMYCNSVGRNCNFVIGAAIDREGLVPALDVQRLSEFGREVRRRWGTPLSETAGAGATVELKFPTLTDIGSIVVMEDIAHGERIQDFTLLGQGGDDEWRNLAQGCSVGHKRIVDLQPCGVKALKLVVNKCKAEPRIRKLAAYASV